MQRSRFPLPGLVAVLLLAACVPGAPSTRPAPRADEISRAEIQASGATTLHALVQAVHPEWLLIATDSTGAPAPGQVLLFVDGRLAGDVRDLARIQTANVDRVWLVDAPTARQRFARFPQQEFRLAIAVNTFISPAEMVGRISVSVGGGITPIGLAQRVESGAKSSGISPGTADPRVTSWPREATRIPLSAHVSARYDVRPALSVTADVQHTLASWFGGYLRPEDDGSGLLSTRFTATELAVLVSSGRLLRLGAGPALRYVQWNWASSLCGCEAVEDRRGTTLGAAAFAGVSIPRRGRWFADFTVRARYYPSQEFGPYRHLRSLDASGLAVTPGVGFGARF
jgi:hypothetical protein